MYRNLAFAFAICMAGFGQPSASSADTISTRFTLTAEHGSSDRISADFHDLSNGSHNNHWSAAFKPSEFIGLDLAGFRSAGRQALRFAVVHEAGRLDCAGNGGSSIAAGNCRFTPNASFGELLAARGIGRPSREQAFALTAIDAHRELVDAFATARYPAPAINTLVALTALGADGRYINDLARAGYRPRTVDTLVQFKAMDITPQWIGGFAKIGYASLPPAQLIQLKALEVTPSFITGFERAGYGKLSADQLLQLKAVGVSPDFARWATGHGSSHPDIHELVRMKVLGNRN